MRRDLPSLLPRLVTANTAARFLYLTEAIARAYEPTPTELETLERAYESTGEHLVACDEFDGLLTHVHAQGSRQLGTIVRPLNQDRDGFDIDLVARLDRKALNRYAGGKGPSLLLEHLYVALKRYADRHALGIKRWERCITLNYAGGMCADFAPVIDDPVYTHPWGAFHGRIPDRELSRYLPTNPRGYCNWFDQAAKVVPVFRNLEKLTASYNAIRQSADVAPLPEPTEVFGRVLSRLVQLVKVHRNAAFDGLSADKQLKPTSVFVTTLLAEAYALEAPKSHEGPLDLVFDMVGLLPYLFERSQLPGGGEYWELMNPTAQNDNLAGSMNTSEKQQAFSQWQQRLLADLNALITAIEADSGVDAIAKIVEQAFGPRAGQGVLQLGSNRRETNRALERAGFFVGGGTVMTPARAHTFYGR